MILKNRLLKENSGFTLVEVMMAVVLVAILAAVGIAQFTDFGKETRNASTKQALGILRDSLQKQYGQMRLRCGINGPTWPALLDLSTNNITSTGGATTTATACGTDKVTSASDRQFYSGSFPENPWSGALATSKNSVYAENSDLAGAGDPTKSCTAGNVAGVVYANTDGGWCYNVVTGKIRTNSNNNSGAAGFVEFNF